LIQEVVQFSHTTVVAIIHNYLTIDQCVLSLHPLMPLVW